MYLQKIMLIFLLFVFFGCRSTKPGSEQPESKSAEKKSTALHHGFVATNLGTLPIEYKSDSGDAVYADERTRLSQVQPKDPTPNLSLWGGTFNTSYWPNATIHWRIDPKVKDSDIAGMWNDIGAPFLEDCTNKIDSVQKLERLFTEVTHDWTISPSGEATGWNFIHSPQGALDFIEIQVEPVSLYTIGPSASAYVGRRKGPQPLKLFHMISVCGKSLLLHELGHSMGFAHEHQRVDRDSSIQVIWKNIPQDGSAAMAKMVNKMSTIYSPYDIDSIMHYPTISWKYQIENYIFANDLFIPLQDRATMLTLEGKPIPFPNKLSVGDYKGAQQAAKTNKNYFIDPKSLIVDNFKLEKKDGLHFIEYQNDPRSEMVFWQLFTDKNHELPIDTGYTTKKQIPVPPLHQGRYRAIVASCISLARSTMDNLETGILKTVDPICSDPKNFDFFISKESEQEIDTSREKWWLERYREEVDVKMPQEAVSDILLFARRACDQYDRSYEFHVELDYRAKLADLMKKYDIKIDPHFLEAAFANSRINGIDQSLGLTEGKLSSGFKMATKEVTTGSVIARFMVPKMKEFKYNDLRSYTPLDYLQKRKDDIAIYRKNPKLFAWHFTKDLFHVGSVYFLIGGLTTASYYIRRNAGSDDEGSADGCDAMPQVLAHTEAILCALSVDQKRLRENPNSQMILNDANAYSSCPVSPFSQAGTR